MVYGYSKLECDMELALYFEFALGSSTGQVAWEQRWDRLAIAARLFGETIVLWGRLRGGSERCL